MSSTAVQLCLLLHVQDHSAGLRLGRDGFSDRSQQARSSSGPTPVSPLRLGARSRRETMCWLRPDPAWGVRDPAEAGARGQAGVPEPSLRLSRGRQPSETSRALGLRGQSAQSLEHRAQVGVLSGLEGTGRGAEEGGGQMGCLAWT